MAEKDFNATKEQVKELLKKINEKTPAAELEAVKEKFKEVIAGANPLVIAAAEGELVKEGHTIEDLLKACEVHLELFKDTIRNPNLKVPDGHPIADFQHDHVDILDIMDALVKEIREAKTGGKFSDSEKTKAIVKKLLDAENHNVRQENTLFPILERHGIEQPPVIMWAEHTDMKNQKKALLKLFEEMDKYAFADFIKQAETMAVALFEKFALHTQKEENILYVTAINVITDEEWKDIKAECDSLGYYNKGEEK